MNKQASQALKLVQGYVKKNFGDSQAVIATQADGKGGQLHVHLLINAVKPRGTTIATNRFSVYKLRKDFNHYMDQNFERVTGRKWINPFTLSKQHTTNNLTTRSDWQNQLKKVINSIKSEVDNVTEFLHQLSKQGITITERGKKKNWTYHQTIKTKTGSKEMKVRAFYQRIDKKTGEVLSTRGLGRNYTKQELENYWNKQKEDQQLLIPVKHSYRKDDKNNDGRDELTKVKTLAAEARARTEQRQRENIRQLYITQRLAEDEKDCQQRHSSGKVRPASRGQSNQGRPTNSSQQERFKEVARRKLQEKQRIARNNHTKDAGPDF